MSQYKSLGLFLISVCLSIQIEDKPNLYRIVLGSLQVRPGIHDQGGRHTK